MKEKGESAVQNLEFAILDWIQQHCRCGVLDTLMPFFTWICAHGEIWILLAAVLLCTKKERHTGAAVAAALILDLLACNVLLKPLVARPRPCTLNGALQLLMAAPSDYSFPSGHAAASFAAVGALRASKSRLWIPAFVLAVVICFSRLYLYHHWPSDVLAGAVLGTVLGYAGQQLSAAAARRLSTRRGH